MIIIVRVQTKEGNDCVWNYVMDNLAELQTGLAGKARLLYLTKRAQHRDTSIFISAQTPSRTAVGDFITEKIASIDGVDGVWILTMLNLRFFTIPQGTQKDLQRYTVTVRSYPRHLSRIYEVIAASRPSSTYVVTYIAYTFHLFGDCLQYSILADSEKTAQGFTKQIESIPGVLKTTSYRIAKTHRLVSKEEWAKYLAPRLTSSESDQEEKIAAERIPPL